MRSWSSSKSVVEIEMMGALSEVSPITFCAFSPSSRGMAMVLSTTSSRVCCDCPLVKKYSYSGPDWVM